MRLLSDAELAQILDKEIFHKISDAADSLGLECYVVGGDRKSTRLNSSHTS